MSIVKWKTFILVAKRKIYEYNGVKIEWGTA